MPSSKSANSAAPQKPETIAAAPKPETLAALFLGADGILHDILPGFESRRQQQQLCDFIDENLQQSRHSVTEAGTGVGKSFAYLIPCIHYALENDCKVIISTKTIALQNQLLTKDIPLIQQAFAKLGIAFQTALGKGRRNYACLNKFRQTLQQALFKEANTSQQYNEFSQWLLSTTTGDRSEIDFPVNSIWPEMCADHLDCLERHCPDYNRCFVQRQRLRLNQADVLVVNHALLFSDLAIRRNGGNGILPDSPLIVMDEAHHLEEIGQSSLGQRLSIYDLQRLLVRLQQKSEGFWSKVNNNPEAKDTVNKFNHDSWLKAQKLFEQADSLLLHNRNYRFLQPELTSDLPADLLKYRDYLQQAAKTLDLSEEDELELGSFLSHLEETTAVLNNIINLSDQQQYVYWADKVNDSITLNATPLHLEQVLQDLWRDKVFVFTSATLSVRGSFELFTNRLGLDNFSCLQLGSPFNYRDNVLLLIPGCNIEPRQEELYTQYLADKIVEILTITQGQTLVLFTSVKQLNQTAELTAAIITQQLGLNLILQDSRSRERLLTEFSAGAGSVLFGLDTFWEGIDIPGDNLSCVIITKLPFPSPGAPVLEARSELIREQGGNPFRELSLPKAVVKFKQGFGRLIRCSTDRGIVAVLDDRITRKGYKQDFLSSIPLTRRSRQIQDIVNFLPQPAEGTKKECPPTA